MFDLFTWHDSRQEFINPLPLFLQFFQTLLAYEEYLVDVAKLLGANEDVKIQANETVLFEKELAKVCLYFDSVLMRKVNPWDL